MASHSDLSLDYKPNIAYPSMIPKTNGDHSDQTNKLQEFLTRLEEERLKIEAFKRELPLCMQLLNNAVDAYKQQLELYRSSQEPKPVLEEFIPIKQIGIEGNDKENNNPKSEKSSWMESAQLWSPSSNDSTKPQIQMKEPSENKTLDMIPKLSLESKQRNGGGAFLPFSKDKSKNDSSSTISPELALVTVEKEREDQKKHSDQMENTNICLKKENGDQIQGKNMVEGQLGTTQSHRKARRCWSPDLHRRFVNALQILGGAQVATPKQIRELMKVDGLTNDEVKSHLQKYRLHTRRPIPAPQQATSAPPQLVVLGGIWVPHPHEYAASAGGPAIYGAHTGVPSHYCTTGPVGAQEFYASQAMMAPHLQHSQIRHGMNGSFKNRHESCESEERSRDNQSESIEEEGEDKEEEEDDDVAQVPGVDGMVQNGTSGTEVALKF